MKSFFSSKLYAQIILLIAPYVRIAYEIDLVIDLLSSLLLRLDHEFELGSNLFLRFEVSQLLDRH